jgi:hypothetical protein
MRLVKSHVRGKKLTAIFGDGAKVHFGAEGYGDYPTYYAAVGKAAADAHKARYIARHSAREDWSDPRSAGTLARYILWNKPTVTGSAAAYRRLFKV